MCNYRLELPTLEYAYHVWDMERVILFTVEVLRRYIQYLVIPRNTHLHQKFYGARN